MNFRSLSSREKNYGVVVCVLGLVIISWGIDSRMERRNARYQDELAASVDKLNQTRTMLEAAVAQAQAAAQPSKPKVESASGAAEVLEDKKLSLFMLRDLTGPFVGERIKVMSTEKKGPNLFQVSLYGEFIEMMNVIGFLERKEGRFLLNDAKITRGADKKGSLYPDRKIMAVITLGTKG